MICDNCGKEYLITDEYWNVDQFLKEEKCADCGHNKTLTKGESYSFCCKKCVAEHLNKAV